MKKVYINFKSGFIRNKYGLEFNWSIYDWALPFQLDFSIKTIFYIRILCFSLFIPIKK